MIVFLRDGTQVTAHLSALELESVFATQTILGVDVSMTVEDKTGYRTIKVSDINVSLTLVHYKGELTSDIHWTLDEEEAIAR